MGHLIRIQQPGRRVMGVLDGSSRGTSKGTSWLPKEEGAGRELGGPKPRTGLDAILNVLSSAASSPSAESLAPVQRVSATGEVFPTSKPRTVLAPRELPWPPAPPPPPAPGPWPPAPPPASGGGGAPSAGGGGGAFPAEPGAAQGGGLDAPVIFGITGKQLLVGGAVALGLYLLTGRKRGGTAPDGGL